jgi:hypothetical protein
MGEFCLEQNVIQVKKDLEEKKERKELEEKRKELEETAEESGKPTVMMARQAKDKNNNSIPWNHPHQLRGTKEAMVRDCCCSRRSYHAESMVIRQEQTYATPLTADDWSASLTGMRHASSYILSSKRPVGGRKARCAVALRRHLIEAKTPVPAAIVPAAVVETVASRR